MPKDNIIQFPQREGASIPSRKIILENRLQELQVENDYLQNDYDYIAEQLELNIVETQEILKQLEKLLMKDLNDSMLEIKQMTGVDLTPLLPEDNNPEED